MAGSSSDVITDDRLRWTLGLGATAGIATMALALIPAVLRTGFRFRPVWNWRHPAVRRLLTMSAWTLGFVAANQVALIVVRNLADPGSGDAAVVLRRVHVLRAPARAARGLDRDDVPTRDVEGRGPPRPHRRSSARCRSALRLIALFTIPAGVGIFVLRRPIVGALLQHGEYGADDALATSRALGGFALGLVGFSVYLFVLRGFYAHHDTRTPFVVNVVRERDQRRPRDHPRRPLRSPRPRAGVRARLHRVGGLGAADHGLQGPRVPGRARSCGASWPMLLAAVLMAEVVWLVAQRHRQQQRHRCGLARSSSRGLCGIAVYLGAVGRARHPGAGRRSRSTARIQERPETVGCAP